MVKIIHTLNLWDYGKTKPFTEKCFESWKTFGNGAEIKVWTENDDIIKEQLETSKFIQHIKSLDVPEYRKRLTISDYLKIFILYEFGGVFLDLDIELKSSLNFDKSYSLNMHLSIAPCTPLYIELPHNQILKSNLDYIELFTPSKEEISDWNMSSIDKLPIQAQDLVDNGLKLGILYNHWISLEYLDKPTMFKKPIDNFLYFSNQTEFDKFLQKNLFYSILKRSENVSFAFIDEDISTPFLYNMTSKLIIFKSKREDAHKYLSYYLPNYTLEDVNEL